jgi:hypothetical protein
VPEIRRLKSLAKHDRPSHAASACLLRPDRIDPQSILIEHLFNLCPFVKKKH